jgi:hypothetical protein
MQFQVTIRATVSIEPPDDDEITFPDADDIRTAVNDALDDTELAITTSDDVDFESQLDVTGVDVSQG